MKIVFMLWSDFKFIIRNFRRNATFSIINLVGLVIGMSCFLLIFIWLNFEIGFDKFHENAENIYRVNNQWPDSDFSVNVPGPTAKMLKDEYPEIINSSLYCELENIKISYEDYHFFSSFTYIDTTFFQMFDFPLKIGNAKHVFNDPHSIVISEEMAYKLFGEDDPLGKTILISDGFYKLKVTGVLEKIPQNSHIKINCLISSEIAVKGVLSWNNNWPQVYVQLAPASNYPEVSEKISGAIIKHLPENVNTLSLEPFSRIHLYHRNGGGLIVYITIFSAIAFIILLIACFNFINLSTAQGIKRFKELGIRKIVGASRKKLIAQLFTETLLMSILAALISLIFLEFLRPVFSRFLEQELVIDYSARFFLVVFGISIITSFIAGLYPTLYFSSVKPMAIFQKNIGRRSGLKNYSIAKYFSLRSILIIIQFVLSISFIVSTIVFLSQLNYINNKELGYNKEGIVLIPYQRALKGNIEVLRSDLLKNPLIETVTFTDPHPVLQDGNSTMIEWNQDGQDKEVHSYFKTINYDYFKTFDIPIVRGRAFDRDFGSEDLKYIVNEKLANDLGFENPIGETICPFRDAKYKGKIIGVVKNFINHDLHEEQRNLVLIHGNGFENICIKMNTNSIHQTLKFIENTLLEMAPNFVFEYEFLEDELRDTYAQEKKTSRLILLAAVLSILLCSLGLYGLVLFIIQQKRKEISIRKVNGASITSIILLILKDFIVWNIVSLIISFPITYLILQDWLNTFAFSIKINPLMYIAAFVISIIISVITVLFHTIKASLENPVNSLRYE